MATAGVLCFFPVMVNTLRGLTSVRPSQIELMRSYAAGEFEIFRRVRIPTALPFVFAALKVATVLAMIGAIVSDYFGTVRLSWDHDQERRRAVRLRDSVGRDLDAPASSECSCYVAVLARCNASPSSGIQPVRKGVLHEEEAHSLALAAIAVVAAAIAAGFGMSRAQAAPKLTKVTLQLKWVTQAQFAGYYAAVEQGYYKKLGLDVKLKVGGPDVTPEQVVLLGAGPSSGSTGCRISSRHARRAARSFRSPRSSHARG